MEASGCDSLCDDADPGGSERRRLIDGEQKAPKGSHFENIIGQGLKHLFPHQRRRSSVSPHDVQTLQEPDPEPDHGQASETEGTTQPTALNRVLQQIRAPPKVKRGSSLQQNRKGKSGGNTRGSPQIGRRSAQDIMAVLSHPARPRSSSTTDVLPSAVAMEASSTCLSGEDSTEKIDRLEGGGLSQASSMVSSAADGMLGVDAVDGTPDPQRTKAAIVQLQQKILKLTEQIKIEQTARDDNVAEYLKLANNADRQQGARIKQVFEKKNQKSSQNILHLQKKLEHYHRRLREVEQNGIARQPKDVFRDMHQGLKDVGARVTGFSEGVVDSVRGGLSSFSQATHSAAGAVVSKPREIASLLRNRFGSSDNIASLDDPSALPSAQGEDLMPGKGIGTLNMLQASPKYGSEEDCSSATSGSLGANSTSGGPGGGGGGGGSSRTNTLDLQGLTGLEVVIHELQEMREAQGQLEESLEGLKSQYQRDYSYVLQALQEERYRCERLEEQLNDLTELHQNEILNLKQELASMEEKIAYQSYERARDIQEALEACQTRISKMELQQQQQQVVQLEGLENATARNLLGKLINVLLAVMAVVLVFVSTVANCVVPLLKTRGRTLGTLLLVVLAAILWKHWDSFSGYLERMLSPPR